MVVGRYKPDEGRNSRQAAFWLGMAMIAYGSYALRGYLNQWVGLRVPMMDSFDRLPVIGVTLSGAFLIAMGVFIGGAYLWVRFLTREKISDHLIEVENELHKVTWPSFKEASNSTVVVIGTVLVLMGFLALSDIVLKKLFDIILWGDI